MTAKREQIVAALGKPGAVGGATVEKFWDEDSLLDAVLLYLDDLREEGSVNMFGAASHIMVDFQMNRKAAGAALVYWMETFEERQGSAA